MNEIPMLAAAAAGMAAERDRLDVEARNVAAAAAAGPGHEYRRLVAQFAVAPAPGDDADLPDLPDPFEALEARDASGGIAPAVRFTGAVSARDPADTMAALIAILDAERGYEANASIFDVGKRLAERTLDMERS